MKPTKRQLSDLAREIYVRTLAATEDEITDSGEGTETRYRRITVLEACTLLVDSKVATENFQGIADHAFTAARAFFATEAELTDDE